MNSFTWRSVAPTALCGLIGIMIGCGPGANPGNVAIEAITASSTLDEATGKFRAQNLVDGDPSTSWCEGVSSDGVGESIEIVFADSVTIERLYVKNGFGRLKYFDANARPTEIQINESNADIELDSSSTGYQRIDLSEPLSGKTFKLKLASVEPGQRWQDTCISEISFDTNTADGPRLPFSINASGWKLTLLEDNSVRVDMPPIPMQCPPPQFQKGVWKRSNSGDLEVALTVTEFECSGDLAAEASAPTRAVKEIPLKVPASSL